MYTFSIINNKNEITGAWLQLKTPNLKTMTRLRFQSGQELREFLANQGYFAIFYCDTECADLEIDHFGLLADGDPIPSYCTPDKLFHLNGEVAVQILDRYLKIGNVKIFPSTFSI